MLFSARISDIDICPIHGMGVIITGMPTVIIGGMPAARVTDLLICSNSLDMIAQGSSTVNIGCLPAARVGDTTVHTGRIATGCFTVIIGG